METKKCKLCGETFDASTEFFYKSKVAKDGLLSYCKVCHKAYNTARYKKAEKEYRWEGTDWEDNNVRVDKFKALADMSILAQYSKASEYQKAYHKRNPEKERAHNRSKGVRRKGYHAHHWNYSRGFEKDVIFLTAEDHAKLHKVTRYDPITKKYKHNGHIVEKGRSLEILFEQLGIVDFTYHL